jgi:colanic acid biosynthesis glycosyl transferase WcaI
LYDVVSGHGTGLAVQPGDVAALVDAIRKLANDSELRDACGLRARAYAEQHLDKDRILAAFEQNLISLCK